MLKAHNVSLEVDGPENTVLHLLREVSFNVPPEHLLAIVGPSGCGKDDAAEGHHRHPGADGGRFAVGRPRSEAMRRICILAISAMCRSSAWPLIC
jgi:ABC-type transport system involved in cytochrome bd biosynthesis fused ATPase/permease subunit